MGSHPYITTADFPTQGPHLGERVLVCFHYDTSQSTKGTMVRNDYAAPWVDIIQLDDGRFVLATECQWQPL
jgi:hypothetical protein